MLLLLKVYSIAALQYIPSRIPGILNLFCAQDDKMSPKEHRLGWHEIVPEQHLRVMCIPGTHLSIMEWPNIEILGRALSSAIIDATNAASPSAPTTAGIR